MEKDAVEAVKEVITPTIWVSSTSEYISFVIDSKMLSNKDNTAVEILTRISRFSLDTKKGAKNYGLLLDIKEICLPQSEITGTGIEIAYTGGNVEFENSSRLVIADGATLSIPSKKINIEVKNLNINSKRISGEIIISGNKNINEISSYFNSKGFKVRGFEKISTTV